MRLTVNVFNLPMSTFTFILRVIEKDIYILSYLLQYLYTN